MHTGLFVAKHKGWLKIEFLSPSATNYAEMPTDKVLRGEADFCIGPPEGLIHHHLTSPDPQLLALVPILKENTSAFAAREDSGIRTVHDWAGKRYAALDLPYEKGMLTAITERAGENPPEIFVPARLDTWKMLLTGKTDLTWIFTPVEGAEAEFDGQRLVLFRPEEYGIPYPPCPVIQTSRGLADNDPQAIRHLLREASRGYRFAMDYPEEAVGILSDYVEEEPHLPKLNYIQKAVNPYYYLTHHGVQYPAGALATYINWLRERGLLHKMPDIEGMVWGQ
jgi:ABC-type nitrate/sulfonate/bicarbonate transport system substrate-binding protein